MSNPSLAAVDGGVDPSQLLFATLTDPAANCDLVERMLSAKGAELGAMRTSGAGDSIAHAAARAGRADVLQLLAEERPYGLDLGAANTHRETPLQLALAGGHEAAALLLIHTTTTTRAAAGAPPGEEGATKATAVAKTHPLVLAAAAGLNEAVYALLRLHAPEPGHGEAEAATVERLLASARGPDGCSALHAAAAGGHTALARRLARAWPDGLADVDRGQACPAEAAAEGGHPELAAALCMWEGAWARRRAAEAGAAGRMPVETAAAVVAPESAAPLAPLAPAGAYKRSSTSGAKKKGGRSDAEPAPAPAVAAAPPAVASPRDSTDGSSGSSIGSGQKGYKAGEYEAQGSGSGDDDALSSGGTSEIDEDDDDDDDEEEEEEEEAAFEVHLRAQAPAEYLCPLSGALLRDAVVALDGVAYDKAAVEAGLLAGPTGAAARFIPHHLLRRLVEAFEAEQKRAWGASRTRTRAGSRVWAVEKAEAIETCAETATAVAVAAIM